MTKKRVVYGLESSRKGSDEWRPYYMLYPTRRAAEVAADAGRPDGTEWRVVTYTQVADEPTDGYAAAFYEISKLLDLPAMPISPKEAFETVMLPKLRELIGPAHEPIATPQWEPYLILEEWLRFASDCQPSDAAGEEWLNIIVARTSKALAALTDERQIPPFVSAIRADETPAARVCELKEGCAEPVWCEAEGQCLAPKWRKPPETEVSPPWQPIETAPAGGKWILLWWPAVTDVAFVGYRVASEWRAATSGETWSRLAGPTHWMPLPEPPAVSEGDAR